MELEHSAGAPRLGAELADLIDGNLRWEDFITAIVHEATQPLAAIQLLTTALRSGGDSIGVDERDRLLADIEGQARFLRELADWMLRRSAREPRRVDELVALAAEGCNVLAPDHEIRTVLECGSAAVACETVRFEAAVRNLVRNAANHAPTGSVITLRSRRQGDRAVISVADQGRGIPRDRWEDVFEPFVRLDDDVEGNGLGLFLVREFAVQNGGHAAIAGSGPDGTTVELSLEIVT